MITVHIDAHGQQMDLDRQMDFYVSQSYGSRFRDAAAELRRIADDIDRMYPAPIEGKP